jgi:16S rRNA (adenine1518-N6/adenine1519-N6)-dimethyltransferase
MSKHSEILQEYSVRAKKSLGQNFLVNDGILEKIATATQVSKKNIIEVGP